MKTGNEKIHSIILIVISLTMIASWLMVYKVQNSWQQLSADYAPLIRTSLEIRTQLAESHLWFEEAISGDTSVHIENIWKALDETYKRARRMQLHMVIANVLPSEHENIEKLQIHIQSLKRLRKSAGRKKAKAVSAVISTKPLMIPLKKHN